ncbi:chromatin assembly factor 1 subunit A-domain-containing protein [Biscogniauxia marginata]|nr:chromatin assembly factor 1 subunit A-domain-containing protein [Biscogniauxia marginata]
MPLFPMSPNVQESEAALRKRTHDEFVDGTGTFQVAIDSPSQSENLAEQKSLDMSASAVECSPLGLTPTPVITMNSPPESSPVALTEAGSSTPAPDSPSPNKTPSKPPIPPSNASTQPPQSDSTLSSDAVKPAQSKKRKLTAAEREQREKERVEKKQKQEAAAAEKAKVAAEREAARVAKAAEKARVDAEKEAKKRKKQEEEEAAQRKQEKQKNFFANFVKRAPTTPSKKTEPQTAKPQQDHASQATLKQETEPTKSVYDIKFQPFFVKPGVTVAPQPFPMDDETKEAKSRILDEYVRGDRGEFDPKPFNPVEIFDVMFPRQRGVVPPSVKKIMERIYGDSYDNAFGVTPSRTESQTEKLVISAQDQLNAIPMKYLRFYEDVRPPYFGTMTTPMSVKKLLHLSRRPTGRTLPLNYDYDSEAEWVEDDGDDGEDLDDAEDDEEDQEGDDEMEDFLDDSEDVHTIIRPGFDTNSQPTSTGICFEDRKRLGPCATVYKFRLEFLLDSLEHHSMIDPFSTAYWPSPAKKAIVSNAATSTSTSTTSMLPPAIPGDAPAAASGSASSIDDKDLVPRDMIEEFKRALISEELKEYSKSTVVEMLAKKFSRCTKAQVKATVDKIAHRVNVPGEKKNVKHWALLPAFELKEVVK